MDYKFHPRFPKERLEFSETATRKGIDNSIPDALLTNACRLSYFLGELETRLSSYGLPSVISISSGYRCPELNKEVGGSPTSDHMDARAADISIVGMTPNRLCSFIQSAVIDHLEQVILEYGKWTHVAIPEDGKVPRQSIKTAIHQKQANGKMKTVYLDGIAPV